MRHSICRSTASSVLGHADLQLSMDPQLLILPIDPSSSLAVAQFPAVAELSHVS